MIEPDNPPARPLRVLVVESDPIAAEAHASHVRRCPSFEVAAVTHSGLNAIKVVGDGARSGRVDLVLLDMNLPDMHGLDFCRAVRATKLPIDMIAVTAVREPAVVRSAARLGIVQYLLKPFTFATLEAKLRIY